MDESHNHVMALLMKNVSKDERLSKSEIEVS